MGENWFSFEGRIGRARMWFLYFATSFATVPPLFIVTSQAEARGATAFFTSLGIAMKLLLGVWVFLILYVLLAAVVKRFHDRNRSAWWLACFFGVFAAFSAAVLMIGWPPREIFPGAQFAAYLLFALTVLNNGWYLLELFVLPGTAGDNRFGPDPLA